MASAGADFAGLPAAARTALTAIAAPRRWRDGQMVLRIGEPAGGVFIVRSGRVRLRALGVGGEERIFGWFGPGVLGMLAPALAETASPCDFVAEGECELLHIPRDRLAALLARDAATALAIARLLSIRLGMVLDMYRLLALDALPDRVWSTLGRLARWAPATPGSLARRGTVEITQADLAFAVGASRFRVGLELQRLAREGRVDLRRGCITVYETAPPRRARRRG